MTKWNELNIDGQVTGDLHSFYDALLEALGAPSWHGRNVNALLDSVVWEGINAIAQPVRITVRSFSNLTADTQQEMRWFSQGIEKNRADFKQQKGRELLVEFVLMG